MFKELFKNKLQKKIKKFYIKEIDVLKLRPFVNSNEDGFLEDDCKKVILNIHESQFIGSKEKFTQEFYRNMNVLLYGCYMAGLQDAHELSEEDIREHERIFREQINVLF